VYEGGERTESIYLQIPEETKTNSYVELIYTHISKTPSFAKCMSYS
jgi:hypothetical protein